MQPRDRRRRSGAIAAIALAGPLMLVPATMTPAKTPGSTYCFVKTCHRVKTIEETRALVGKTLIMQASFYDDPSKDSYNPRNLTSSGEYFRSGKPDNAASPILPDGTKVLVWHPGSKRAIVVRINNAGPYWGSKRLIDLSRAGAERLGFTHSGVSTVHVKVLEAPTRAEATYRRGRTYEAVPGYIGAFASVDDALADAGQRLALNFERNVPVTVASANEALVRLQALQGDHDAGNTVTTARAEVAELAAPAELGGPSDPATPLLVAAPAERPQDRISVAGLAAPVEAAITVDEAPRNAPTAVASLMTEIAPPQSPSAPVVATAASAVVSPAPKPLTVAPSTHQAAVAVAAQTIRSRGEAVMKPVLKLETRSAEQPAPKSAKPPVQALVARAEPKPAAKPVKTMAETETDKVRTKVATAGKPPKAAKPMQPVPADDGEDAPAAASGSAKLARLAQAPKPAVQPSPLKIPQSPEPDLDRRVWFRTALSMN